MNWTHKVSAVSFSLVVLALSGCAATGDSIALRITGAEEVPPVSTGASGTGSITVADDRSVSGSFKTSGGAFTAAHIHEGAAGQNGPVIIPLQKKSDNEWAVPGGARFTEAQYAAYKQGRLYVNFHSAQHKGGEIRSQIKPSGGGRSSSGY
jgi:hypothetical protein